MSDQNIGVRAQFLTPQFSRGLARYFRGLSQAIAITNQTTAAINNLGAQSAAVFATLQGNARTTANALRSVAQAANAANRALAGSNRRRAPTVAQPRGSQGLNQTLAAQTTRANAQATAQINAAAAATRNLGQQARVSSISISTLNARTIALGTALGTVAGNAIVGLAGNVRRLGSEVLEIVTFFERLELSVAFFTARSLQAEDATLSFDQALAQGEAQAQGLLIWLQRLAVASPFTTRTVGILFRTAQAYGLTRREAELLTPLLLDFGAAAGLNEDILERLALAIGQIRSRGKLTGEEVRQLGNSGLPVRDILVEALGIANAEFDELLESGALTTNVVIPHLIEALKNFEGAGARVAFGTIGGIISAMEELREISTAKFFTGFLEPLKDSLQELFKVLNQPEVLAFVTILGQELGTKFRDAIFGAVAAVRAYLTAFQELDPTVKQQIIVFAAATAGVIALTAAFGLLTLAMGVIANPLVLIATTIGFLVSEWTSGFAVLRTVTSRVGRAIGSTLLGIVRALGATVIGMSNFIRDMTLGFNTLEGAVARFGFNIGASLAEGIAQSGGVIASVLRGIGKLLSFWLAPGSPPRIAPDIDVWGRMTIEEFAGGMGRANFTNAFQEVRRIMGHGATQQLVPALKEVGFQTMEQYAAAVEDADVIGPARKITRSLIDTLSDDSVQGQAEDAGIQVSESYVDGFLSRIPTLVPRMSEELQEVLGRIGSGQQLSQRGAFAFGRFLEGFEEADFGVLDTTTDIVQSFFQSLVDTGQIDDVDLPRLIFGAREGFAEGIQDIERTGAVTERTMQRIRATAGGASDFVLKLLTSYAPLRQATERVEQAQTTLNEITEKYKGIITPLRKELEAINEANRVADDQEKILSLQRLIANAAVSDRRRSNAQLQINQIVAEQRLRGLEQTRDAAVETAEEELTAQEKVRDQLQKQFDGLQQNIQAQLTQLGLFGQEASIIKRLREEAEKLREKEMTEAELQVKFLELQGEEIADLIKAAKAKYDLTRADSTELERQQAQIALAEVALARRNREAEAIKLGIPVEELTKLRDFVVTLDDIGVKTKEAFDTGELNLGEGIVDANAITEEWEATLIRVRDKWTEIKTQITETATQINENLPSFLKIFPETEGGEPPIIGFIRDYSKVIVGLAVAMTTYKIVAKIASLVGAIRSLMTVGALTTAAGGAGGLAAAGGGSAAIAAITSSVVALGAAAGAATVLVLGLKQALAGFGASEQTRFEGNTEVIDTTLGDFGPGLEKSVSELAKDVTLNNEGATALADNIISAATSAIQDGFGDEHVTASIGNAINRSIIEGIIADTPANRQAITDFQAGLVKLLSTNPTGEAPKVNIFTGAEISGTPDEAQATAVKTDVQNFLAGITDENTEGAFAENMRKLIVDATSLGLSRAKINELVFGAFAEGVNAGLTDPTIKNTKAIASFIDGVVAEMEKAAEIESPSKLTKRKIGLPMGQGIIGGLRAALLVSSPQLLLEITGMVSDIGDIFDAGQVRISDTAELIRTNVSTSFQNLKTLLVFRMAEITNDQQVAWEGVRTDTETSVDTMEASVITSFTTMRTASEAQVVLLRAAMVRLFGGGETGILTAIRTTFLGEDNIIPRTIGKNFIEGIGKGITENRDSLAVAFTNAIVYALGEARTTIVGSPLAERTGARVTTPNSATSTTNNRTSNYTLNVNSTQQSQGIISDFGIMQTLEGG